MGAGIRAEEATVKRTSSVSFRFRGALSRLPPCGSALMDHGYVDGNAVERRTIVNESVSHRFSETRSVWTRERESELEKLEFP